MGLLFPTPDHPLFVYPTLECVIRLPCCVSLRKKHRRRRGKHGGVRVAIRKRVSVCPAHPGPCQLAAAHLGWKDLFLARRWWDPRYSCHVSITLHQPQTPVSSARPRMRICSRVNSLNIRPLDYSRCPPAAIHSMAKVALVNSRSVSNKTFVLNDSQPGLTVFNRNLHWRWSWPVFCFRRTPINSSFVSTPRCAGRGGGVALVFKNHFKLQTL